MFLVFRWTRFGDLEVVHRVDTRCTNCIRHHDRSPLKGMEWMVDLHGVVVPGPETIIHRASGIKAELKAGATAGLTL